MPCLGLRSPMLWASILAVSLLICESGAARAQIRVDGPADAVRIDVVNAPLRDVLGTLRTKYGLRYRGNDALDAMKTVRLTAPLRRVVARLLEGCDFVIAATPSGLDVLVLRQSVAGNIVIPRAAPAQASAPPGLSLGARLIRQSVAVDGVTDSLFVVPDKRSVAERRSGTSARALALVAITPTLSLAKTGNHELARRLCPVVMGPCFSQGRQRSAGVRPRPHRRANDLKPISH
jgi:hypothetical protein